MIQLPTPIIPSLPSTLINLRSNYRLANFQRFSFLCRLGSPTNKAIVRRSLPESRSTTITILRFARSAFFCAQRGVSYSRITIETGYALHRSLQTVVIRLKREKKSEIGDYIFLCYFLVLSSTSVLLRLPHRWFLGIFLRETQSTFTVELFDLCCYPGSFFCFAFTRHLFWLRTEWNIPERGELKSVLVGQTPRVNPSIS